MSWPILVDAKCLGQPLSWLILRPYCWLLPKTTKTLGFEPSWIFVLCSDLTSRHLHRRWSLYM